MKRHWYPQDEQAGDIPFVRFPPPAGRGELHAWYSHTTGDLMLTRGGQLLVCTRSPGAFDAGLRLVCSMAEIVIWHGFVVVLEPYAHVLTYGAPDLLPDLV